MDTPFRWTKQVASYFGGTRNAMVISWPKGIQDDQGKVREQNWQGLKNRGFIMVLLKSLWKV